MGFADLVSYTRLSQRLEERELALLVDRFGRRSSDVIAGAGGRLVKTIGDEVLFVADTPAAAATIGLELAEAMAADPELPDVRVGIATGTVLTRMGDVFGRTVNLASRLTALAAPGHGAGRQATPPTRWPATPASSWTSSAPGRCAGSAWCDRGSCGARVSASARRTR